MDSRSLSTVSQPALTIATQTGHAITDGDLSTLAATSAVAAYVRSLTTDSGRASTMQALSVAAEHLAPGFLPQSKGRGRGGNGAERFALTCTLPFHQLRVDRLSELRASLMRSGAAAATVNKVLAAVKGVLQQCWQQGLLDGESLARAKAALKSVRGSTLPKGRHLPKAEIARLFRAISKTPNPAAARDAAMLALLCIGLRRAEVAGLKITDYDHPSGRLVVRGKGNKERAVFLTNGAKSAVEDWLAIRGEAVSEWLLLQVNKGGKVVADGITPQSVYATLLKRAEQAGLEVSPHDFRRTFIGEALTAGVDVVTVQHLVGHSSPTTTAKYDRRGDEMKKSAMAVISVPYLPSAAGAI
jgi:site-specific recombinase XerD